MPAGIWFWIIYVIFVLLGGFFWWPRGSEPNRFYPFGGYLVVMVLIGLLGWGVFGPPIK